MTGFVLASIGEVAAGSFGIAAAVLIVGGIVFLRWQRDRAQFELMRLALQQGITVFPSGLPFWVLSLRQGILILVLGAGLLGAGAAGWGLARGVEPPPQGASHLLPPTTLPLAIEKPAAGKKEERGARAFKMPPTPAMERWERAQKLESGALLTMGSGFILVLLGLARMAFAQVERRHTGSADTGPEEPRT